MEVVEHVDGQDVEPCATVDEGLGNLHIADDWGAKHREGASGGRALELICRVESDGALGLLERARGLELGEHRVHLASELYEDALRGWGLGAAQHAGDCMRLLEAPSPLVLMVVVVPSWWRQWGKTSIALGAILTRLVPPGPLARMVLPAVLTRPVAPLLARAKVVPASASTSFSAVVAPVVALGASTIASFSYGSELLTVAGVVGVQVVAATVGAGIDFEIPSFTSEFRT